MKKGKATLCGLLLLITLAAPAWGQENKRLTIISYPARPPKLPLWLARDEGLFARRGLNVVLKELESNDELLGALGRRDGDLYAATATHVVSGIGDGADLVFIANTGYSVLKLLSRPEIVRTQDLKGKRVGTGEAGSNQDRITRQTLIRLGLNPDKDVILVPFGSRSIQRLNALVEGKIDATTSNEENIYDLERSGGISKVRVLADNDSLKLYIGAGVDFAVSRALLARETATVKNFLSALCEAIALAKNSRATADRGYAKYLGMKDPAMLDFIYRTYVLGAIPERPFPKSEVIALGLEEFGAKPGVKGKKAEDLIDTSLLRELENEGFFDRLYAGHQVIITGPR
jgi:ABC-type nitrate/sulfonate/bicarbonate transport system substrate-binding protein